MKHQNRWLGWVAIATLALVPVVLWYLAPTYPPRFRDLETAIFNLGQITGLIGAVLLSLNFILSTRLRLLEKWFKGLNDVYIKHELVGKIAFALLLFHPLLLLGRYTSGVFGEMVAFLLPGAEWDINFGIIALGLMLLLITLTLYLRPRYDYWKITHKFFGLTLIFAGLHIWFIPSDVSRYMPLRYYMLALVFLGLVAYTYKTLLGWILAPKEVMRVSEVKKKNHNVTEITLKPEKKFEFEPGQFIFISFEDEYLGRESHPYSFVSASGGEEVKIAIKDLGDYTSKIDKLKVGARAKVEGPFGIFCYKNARYKKQVWIAGGIGITPFVSMAEDLGASGSDYNVDLFYAMKNQDDAVYLDRLNQIAKNLSGKLRVYPVYFDKHGFLQMQKVKETVGDLHNKDIFVCGPPKMMQMVKRDCLDLDVKADRIHSEEFSL